MSAIYAKLKSLHREFPLSSKYILVVKDLDIENTEQYQGKNPLTLDLTKAYDISKYNSSKLKFGRLQGSQSNAISLVLVYNDIMK